MEYAIVCKMWTYFQEVEIVYYGSGSKNSQSCHLNEVTSMVL